MFFETDDIKAEKRLKQVIQIIEDQDKDALKALFSKQALDEAEGFDENVEHLFELFRDQNKIEISDFAFGPINESIRYGKKSKMVVSACQLITDDRSYVFFLIDYTIDTIDPNNAGLYTLRITEFKEELSWQEKMIPGIYTPNNT